MLVLGGCSSVTSASGNKPNPAETTMAQNKVASYFLDAYCPVQTVYAAAPGGNPSLADGQAWARKMQLAIEKAQSTLADPGAKWPGSVAKDVASFSDLLKPQLDYYKAIQQEKTLTGVGNLPRPKEPAGAEAVQKRLSAVLGVDLGSSDPAKCNGHG